MFVLGKFWLYYNGFSDFSKAEAARNKPVRQILRRSHPVTGRKSLYLSSHAGAIVGWPRPEAAIFLMDLTEHATQRCFVHAHTFGLHPNQPGQFSRRRLARYPT